jgi:hypothetical protein
LQASQATSIGIRGPRIALATSVHDRLLHRLPMWTIYRPVTREYPGWWVARMFLTRPECRRTRFVIARSTLSDLRAALPPGLSMLARDPNDVPEIEESWF